MARLLRGSEQTRAGAAPPRFGIDSLAEGFDAPDLVDAKTLLDTLPKTKRPSDDWAGPGLRNAGCRGSRGHGRPRKIFITAELGRWCTRRAEHSAGP
jgi:hypothetical protein